MKIIYQDKDLLVVDKPAGVTIAPETRVPENGSLQENLVDELLASFPELKKVGKPPRYGIVHRLDKDTSGLLLIAKNNPALSFFQKQFRERKVEKEYLALVLGQVKKNTGKIETLMGRSRKDGKRQKAYLPLEPAAQNRRLRRAETEYEVRDRFERYTLLEAKPKTGRKHQIRCHLAFLGHPIAGDKIYRYKNQPLPQGLSRHFLHARRLRITLPDGSQKEFIAPLPKDLKATLSWLKKQNKKKRPR